MVSVPQRTELCARIPTDVMGSDVQTASLANANAPECIQSRSTTNDRSKSKLLSLSFTQIITRGNLTSLYREGEFHTTLSNLTHPLRINSPLSGQPKPCPRGGSSVVMSAVSRHSKVNTGNFQNDSGAHSSGMRHSKTSCSVICDWEVEGGPWGEGGGFLRREIMSWYQTRWIFESGPYLWDCSPMFRRHDLIRKG